MGLAGALCRSPVGAVALTARAHDCGPEPSLRTSPSSSSSRPTALPSDSLGRIEVARSQGHRADGLPASWPDALLGRALTTSAAGPAEWRPRGRPYSAYAVVGVCAVVAFANAGSRFLMAPPQVFWGGKGWRAARTVLRMPTRCAPRTGVQVAAIADFTHSTKTIKVVAMRRIASVNRPSARRIRGDSARCSWAALSPKKPGQSSHTRSEKRNDAPPRVSSKRPPARPAWSGPRKIFHHPHPVARTLRKQVAPADVRLQLPELVAAVACGARGVDKPEGI